MSSSLEPIFAFESRNNNDNALPVQTTHSISLQELWVILITASSYRGPVGSINDDIQVPYLLKAYTFFGPAL